MAKLWSTLLGRSRVEEISRYSWDQYTADLSLAFNGSRYLLSNGSTGWAKTEDIETSFTGYVNNFYKSNGIVFAIVLARMMLFTEGRFCWWNVGDNGEDGKPAGRSGLEVLERPWPNAGTGELLARMEQDVSLGGNFYAVREPDRLRRLRPDWVTIVLTAPPAEATQADVAGYWYHPGRVYSNAGEPQPGDDVFMPDEICHWSPIPDPDAQYRGMSWLTPVMREVQADKASNEHKLNFFVNGASLGPIISAKENLTPTQFKEWETNVRSQIEGVTNAYRPLFLASPVDTSIRTADMRQLDFKVTQGAGETRLCASGGVPPIIVGLSEGLASATYSNYGMARRKFGDHWGRPQWKSASTALSTVVEPPEGDLRLGVNVKDIAFLREDRKDQAEITQTQILALEAGIRAGYKPDALVEAVTADDISLLLGQHTGLTSVQLLPPGARDEDGDGSVDVTAADDAAAEDYQDALESLRSEPLEWDIARGYYGEGAGERIAVGHKGGGRFRKLSDRITDALEQWLRGEGDDDPLDGFTREQVRKSAVELGLKPRRGASADEIKLQLLHDARRRHRETRQADADAAEAKDASARFNLGGGRVAAVYQESDGRVSLYEDRNGKRGPRVVTVPDLAGLEDWADEHGHPNVAEWSRTERRDLEDKAVAGQGEADKARAVSELLSEVDELVDSEASPRALRARIKARAKLAGSPDDLRDELLANAGDREALRDVVDRAEQDNGLTPIGAAGQTVKFDRNLHQSIAGDIPDGASVVVVRRGHKFAGKERSGTIRATVMEADDAPSPAPVKAVKKAVPRKAAPAPKLTADQFAALGFVEKHGELAGRPTELAALEKKGLIHRDGRDITLTDAGREALLGAAPESPQAFARQVAGEATQAAADLPPGPDRIPAIVATMSGLKRSQLRAVARELGIDIPPDGALGTDTDDGLREFIARTLDSFVMTDPRGNLGLRKAAPRKAAAAASVEPAGTVRAEGFNSNLNVRLRVVADGNGGYVAEKQQRATGEWVDAPAYGTGSTPKEVTARFPKGQWRFIAAPKTGPAAPSLTGEEGLSPDPAVREVQIENRIRAAYLDVPRAPGGWVGLADIRDRVGSDVPRTEVDDALRRLARQRERLDPFDNTRGLDERDRAAAVDLGGGPLHMIALNDPSPRPLPAAGGLRKTAAPAVADKSALDTLKSLGEPDAIRDELDLRKVPELKELLGAAGLSKTGSKRVLVDRLVEYLQAAPLARSQDVTPGHDELHHYWTRGEGLAKWKTSPKPWTTLVALLTEHVGEHKAKVFASRWFHEVFGFYAGSDLNRVTHGKPPRGDRVGPG